MGCWKQRFEPVARFSFTYRLIRHHVVQGPMKDAKGARRSASVVLHEEQPLRSCPSVQTCRVIYMTVQPRL